VQTALSVVGSLSLPVPAPAAGDRSNSPTAFGWTHSARIFLDHRRNGAIFSSVGALDSQHITTPLAPQPK